VSTGVLPICGNWVLSFIQTSVIFIKDWLEYSCLWQSCGGNCKTYIWLLVNKNPIFGS